MRRFRFGKRDIRFTEKKHPVRAIISVVIGIVSLCMMLTLFILSGTLFGNGGAIFGYLGIVDLFLALIGLILSMECVRMEDIYFTFVKVGIVINGLVLLNMAGLYVLGIVI